MLRGFGFALFVMLLLAPPVFARDRNTGDLFSDQGWAAQDRPSVPSDRNRSGDMFKTPPPISSPNADVFDRVKPDYDFGREDMVYPHPAPIPHYPLFSDPMKEK